MIRSGTGGSIINIASMSGSVVNYPQEQSCYNASKAAVVQLTKSLAAEWARYGIRVNSISPGYMDTALNRIPALDAQKRIWIDQTPQKRLGNPADLNCLAVYLASEGSGFMTGNNCLIDGGYTLGRVLYLKPIDYVRSPGTRRKLPQHCIAGRSD